MVEQGEKKYFQWAIYSVLIITFLKFFVAFYTLDHFPEHILRSDSRSYINSAKALFYTGKFAVHPDHPEFPQTMRTPGYPAFLFSVFQVFGMNLSFVIYLQIIFTSLTSWLVYLLAVKVSNSVKVGFICCFIFCLDITSFLFSQLILTESIFTFSLLISIFYLIHHLTAKSVSYGFLFLFSLFFSISILVRPINYYLLLPVFLFLLIDWYKKKCSWIDIGKALVIFWLPIFILIGGWQYRNYQLTGIQEISTIQARNLLFYRAGAVLSAKNNITLSAAQEKIREELDFDKDISVLKANQIYTKKAKEIIINNSGVYIFVALKGVCKILFGWGEYAFLDYLGIPTGFVGDFLRLSFADYSLKWFSSEYITSWILGMGITIFACLYLCALYMGLIISFWKIFSSENKRIHFCLGMMIIYFLIVSAGGESYERFRIPIMPLLAVYGGIGINHWLNRFRSE
ncbi:MAG: glycosyltransferase family 39 protein [Candidatus Omnitrophica bacterium]|nr:glycosyltransferase family 39 protein [Candidatus Omnitrophota bacterium]